VGPLSSIRSWAARHTGAGRYSPVGQAFHWLMAALVLFQLGWGWRIGALPAGPAKLEGYALHSQLGLVLLVLIGLRAVWRLLIAGPETAADEPGLQSLAGHLTHYAFYGLLIALPVSGWVIWSVMAFEYPLLIAGVIDWPVLPLADLSPDYRRATMHWAVRLHGFFVWTLIVLILLHVAGALKHHFFDRDDVLAAMVPFLQPPEQRPEAEPHSGPVPRSPPRSRAG
jgi:cytochrome b561